ncbi:LysR family transcriptional regulator [Roseateles chitosanitabidus]|uniref:LysR family transcriptional regulator n=1 Tax=Roseateles chitosanitabidus TaxID=65048 RepID=UPI000830E275|nr:LysR family transcriptional regulator [Roseateles chitosanitabidus]
MLNPQWLRSFATLARLGSFTRAAEALDLTQAAVSQHVRHLESSLGPLVIRRPRAIELTPAGQATLDYWRELDEADQRLRGRLADENACQGEVGIITPGGIGLLIYPRLLDLQAQRPGLVVRHRFAPDPEVLQAVLDNRFELGLVTLRPDDARLASCAFLEERLELVMPAGEQVECWEDLRRIGFIDYPDGQAMANRLLSRHFPGSPGVKDLPVRGFSNQIGLMLEPVARGLGFTVLTQHARRAFPRQDEIRVLDCGSPVVDTLWLIHRAEWPLSARAQHVVEHLRGTVGAMAPSLPAGKAVPGDGDAVR